MKNQRRFAPTKTGRLAPEWVAAFLRNQWPESAEYAVRVAASNSFIPAVFCASCWLVTKQLGI
jgi:hypothetical protein